MTTQANYCRQARPRETINVRTRWTYETQYYTTKPRRCKPLFNRSLFLLTRSEKRLASRNRRMSVSPRQAGSKFFNISYDSHTRHSHDELDCRTTHFTISGHGETSRKQDRRTEERYFRLFCSGRLNIRLMVIHQIHKITHQHGFKSPLYRHLIPLRGTSCRQPSAWFQRLGKQHRQCTRPRHHRPRHNRMLPGDVLANRTGHSAD